MRRLLPSMVLALFGFAIAPAISQDTIPPVISCPGNMAFTLAPGACKMPVYFNVSATDNASTPWIVQIDGTGYTSGSDFPIGVHNLVFVASDSSFNTDTCAFSITINNFTPQTNGVACDDLLNISMPATCEMWLTPAMVLEGDYGCHDDFFVDVNKTGSNYIGYYYVGKTIGYKITNTATGNSCWGELKIEDKAGPLIEGCDSVSINCLEDPAPTVEGGVVPTPLFTDCLNYDTLWVDMVTQGQCNANVYSQIMRIWSATDSLGNSSTCNQIITIDRLPLDSLTVSCPPDTLIECVPGTDPDLSPAATGYPYVVIDSVTYYITDGANSLCNISASYSDQVVPVCGASYRIIRTWTILDWCQDINMTTNPIVCKQIITYSDKTAPQLTLPPDFIASANLPGCRARPDLPAATVEDCSSWSVIITTPVGPLGSNGGKVPAPGLPIGENLIIYKATDACGNSTADTLTITVVDDVKPNAVCDQHTVVALDGQGYGFAYAQTFDDGSTDNCCIQGFAVAKITDACNNPDNLVYDDYIDFCCMEVGQTIMVSLRVFDCHDNYNECLVSVVVQDQAGPSITCPPDLTVYCGQDYQNLALTGNVVTDPQLQGPNDGLATDNCGANLTITHSDEGVVDCGSGLVYRTFLVTDPAGLEQFCVQRITVENNNPFTGQNIIFPPDTTIYGCASSTVPANTGQPSLPPPSPCAMLTAAFSDQIFNSIPGACQKIYRTWSVIDMCQYDPNNPGAGGIWTHTQEILVIDNTPPVATSCEDRTFCNFKADCGPIAPDLSIIATDACTPDSLLYFTWNVDLGNDGSIDDQGAGLNTTSPYPMGTHRIDYNIIDACGNISSCSFSFSIADCKKPTVFCNSGLVVTIMQTGMIDVAASQLEQGSSYDNCTPRQDLLISFSPNPADSVRTFTCDDVGQQLVQVWVTDAANNQDYCETTLTIQDNMTACADTLVMLSGTVANENAQGVETVTVELNGDVSSMAYTNSFGVFQFPDVPAGYDFTVTPYHNNDPLNGVTTFDIVLLQRHILHVQLLDSPYKVIAADVNNNGDLTVSDVVDLRKLVLHSVPGFPNNTAWRFVDAQWTFADPLNPFEPAFPEVCNLNDLAANQLPVDFVAVKIGDLNNSAITSSLQGDDSDERAAQVLPLRTPQQHFKAGQRIQVPISARLNDMLGYQFTLEFDAAALQLEDLQPGQMADLSNFGLNRVAEGVITTSWSQVYAFEQKEELVLFTLHFRANKDGKLSDVLSLSSRYTAAEGYNANGEVLKPVLELVEPNGTTTSQRFELYQNVPNPFTGETVIGFELPKATQVKLQVFDVAGQVVKELRGQFAAGYHEVILSTEDFMGRGVYFYRLETPEFTATKKMTMLE